MKDRLLKWLITASETDQIAPHWLLPEQTPKTVEPIREALIPPAGNPAVFRRIPVD